MQSAFIPVTYNIPPLARIHQIVLPPSQQPILLTLQLPVDSNGVKAPEQKRTPSDAVLSELRNARGNLKIKINYWNNKLIHGDLNQQEKAASKIALFEKELALVEEQLKQFPASTVEKCLDKVAATKN